MRLKKDIVKNFIKRTIKHVVYKNFNEVLDFIDNLHLLKRILYFVSSINFFHLFEIQSS